jgi:hypothetical protein
MTLNGICDLIPFLNYLKEHKIYFQMEHSSAETLSVLVHLVGQKIEIDFHDASVDCSSFSGHEDVLTDQAALFGMLEEYWQS